MGPGKHVLDRGAHWHNLANTIEQVMCGSNAVFFFQKTVPVIGSAGRNSEKVLQAGRQM